MVLLRKDVRQMGRQNDTAGVKLSSSVEELSKRLQETTSNTPVTIDMPNECLDELCIEHNSKEPGYKGLTNSTLFRCRMEELSFIELGYFFFDIILSVRAIGGLENMFVNRWHPDARDCLSILSDSEAFSLGI